MQGYRSSEIIFAENKRDYVDTVTLKSDGVALATLATKATANIIIIAQARATGNQPAAGNQEQSCCGGELSYLLTLRRGASQRPQRRYSATLRRTALAGRHSLRTPGAVPASSGGRIDE